MQLPVPQVGRAGHQKMAWANREKRSETALKFDAARIIRVLVEKHGADSIVPVKFEHS
jgi:hypothetical protein